MNTAVLVCLVLIALSRIPGKENEYFMVFATDEVFQTLCTPTKPERATLPNAGNSLFTSPTSLQYAFRTCSNYFVHLVSLLLMGLRMDDLHAPTVASGPTSHAQTNGTAKEPTFQELVAQKENLEAELSALGSVLESVQHLYPKESLGTLLTWQ